MLLRIGNTPRDYAWGSRTAIAELQGRAPSGSPEAELWLGGHPGSPSVIELPQEAGGAADLAEWINSEPVAALGGLPALPFLLKILAADLPLSLQVHPSLERAKEGFRRENEAGIPINAPHRNYRDALHKPEAVVALSERFEALCGFRPIEQSRAILRTLVDSDAQSAVSEPEILAELAARLEGEPVAALKSAVGWLLTGGPQVEALVSHVTHLVAEGAGRSSAYRASFATVTDLAAAYPGDPGVVISLFLNRVTLTRGQALYLPAGNIHAYLSGLAVEVMAASDNVLRGGLTGKHVDIAELLKVAEFVPGPVPYLEAETSQSGLDIFRPDVPDFLLVRAQVDASQSCSFDPKGPAIVLCIAGEVQIEGERSSGGIARGHAVYVTPDEGRLSLRGNGVVFLAAPGDAAALAARASG